MTDPIRILVVDDHSLFRSGIIHSFDSVADIKVVGEAADGQTAVQRAHALLPDVILLDVTMKPVGGLEALKRLAEELPVCKVIMLTVTEDENTLLTALKAGARGYVLKGVSAGELAQVIRAVYAGEVYVTPTMAASLLIEMATGPSQPASDPVELLTEQERAILELVAQGYTNKQVGQQLHLAEKTVKHYMTNILQKLQVNNRVQAALIATKQGLVKGDSSTTG
ncbi:MAG: response regulator transcription factor [Anaerolineae bacterium]|nr:response regulator transcription factor [Anaerolineae bacterium]